MSLVSASAQHISCNIMRKDGTCSCLVSFIYALNSVYDRRLLWSDLISLQESQLIKENKRPWCLLGDFNFFSMILKPIETCLVVALLRLIFRIVVMS